MRRFATATVGALLMTLVWAAAAVAQVEPYEDAADQFRNILPPGQNGHANAADIAEFMATGERPPHNSDQLGMYEDLVYASPELRRSQIPEFFKDSSFGVPKGDREERYRPCGAPSDPCEPSTGDPTGADHPCREVTVLRDGSFGVPHIYGKTRAGTMCAAGYVAGEDRLLLVDILRHAGRAELSEFAGGTEGNRAMDREQWAIAPYRERDLRKQYTQFDDIYGRRGAKLQRDLRAYIAGLNQYRFEARVNRAQKLPGAYFALPGVDNKTFEPERFRPTDVVAIASLVGGIFGKGGGAELESAKFLQAVQDQFGREEGEQVWEDFRSAEDPEAPTTVFDESFPYMARPAKPADGSRAIPDRGSLKETGVRVTTTSPTTDPVDFGLDLGGALLELGGAASNALLVSGRESRSGHPLAVFGPQTGYFSPQLLMEMDIHGPGIDARGAAFAGTNLYVQLGRGVDYAWSATSAGSDNVDTFALDLCRRQGPKLSDYRGYVYRGRCTSFEPLKRNNVFTPNASGTETGSETLTVNRTRLGLEVARARLDGRPVVYVSLRSTYLHEVDSALGFADFNNPNKVRGPRSYQRAASQIEYTFNWFYTDEHDIAYFNSAATPERADGVDPNFPVRACPTAACEYEWDDYEPIHPDRRTTGNRAAFTPFGEHPQTINQRYLTSWNNKQAPGYRANDAQFNYTSVYRSEPLDDRIRREIKGPGKMTLPDLIDAMEDAGTVDLRGDKVLPWMLRVLESTTPSSSAASEDQAQGGEAQASQSEDDDTGEVSAAAVGRNEMCPENLTVDEAIDVLARWERSGAHRRDMNRDGIYDRTCAVQLMDAWWPIVIEKIFKTVLGEDAYEARLALGEIDNEPNNHGAHLGSAYQTGFYGYLEKDLRTLLGRDVEGKYSRTYCGGDGSSDGTLESCRDLLERTLEEAIDKPREKLYDDDPICSENPEEAQDDQYCYDAIAHVTAGAISQPLIHWVNRPTFQQVVEVKQNVPRDSGGGGNPGGNGGGDGDGGDGIGRAGDSGSGGAPAPSGGERSPAEVAAGAATSASGRAEDLPFTGLTIGGLLLTGALLALGGAVLRRRARG